MSGQRPHLLQFPGNDSRYSEGRGALCFTRLPSAFEGVAQIETLYCIGEIAHEIAPPQFTGGEDLKSELLLLRQHAGDVAILEFVQPLRIFAVAPRFQQIGRPQEAPDVIGPVCPRYLFATCNFGAHPPPLRKQIPRPKSEPRDDNFPCSSGRPQAFLFDLNGASARASRGRARLLPLPKIPSFDARARNQPEGHSAAAPPKSSVQSIRPPCTGTRGAAAPQLPSPQRCARDAAPAPPS